MTLFLVEPFFHLSGSEKVGVKSVLPINLAYDLFPALDLAPPNSLAWLNLFQNLYHTNSWTWIALWTFPNALKG